MKVLSQRSLGLLLMTLLLLAMLPVNAVLAAPAAQATSVTVTGLVAKDKVYNRNRTAQLDLTNVVLQGVDPGDDVTLDITTATRQFDTASVGTGKTVTVTGLSLTGADAANYTLSNPNLTLTASITPRPLTVTATGVNKTYDGTTAATVTLSTADTVALADMGAGALSLGYTSAAFDSPTVGTNKTVNVSGISLGGTAAGNYTLQNTTAMTTADITKAPLTVTATNQAIRVGQPDPTFTFTYSGFVNGETSAVLNTQPTCTVSGAHSAAGTYPIVCSGGSDDQYSFNYVNGTLLVGEVTFNDVPVNYWAWEFIERLYNAGITSGCGNGNYCPEGLVTRAQMAVFLLRAVHDDPSYTPPAVGDSTGFSDIPTDYWAAAWIKQLAAEGITAGCGGGKYCPEAAVTRAEMAVFLLRSKHGPGYAPPPVGDGTGFNDVVPGSFSYWAAAWIKQLVAEGITAGCGNNNYCPDLPVNRAQMAVFLVRAFGLPALP